MPAWTSKRTSERGPERRLGTPWLTIALHTGALIPLVVLAWRYWQGGLGPASVGAVIRRLGRYALGFLILSLAPTAIRTITGYGGLLRVRRALGLYAFFYAALHALAFAGLDYEFRLGLLFQAIGESRREIVGLLALIILVALAVTSIPSLMRRLGRYWQWLHRLVYAAGALVVLHYIWNYKALRTWPALAGAALALLLAARLMAWLRPRPRRD